MLGASQSARAFVATQEAPPKRRCEISNLSEIALLFIRFAEETNFVKYM